MVLLMCDDIIINSLIKFKLWNRRLGQQLARVIHLRIRAMCDVLVIHHPWLANLMKADSYDRCGIMLSEIG